MTGKELFQEIGMIKEEYIVEAEAYKRSVIHNVVFRRSLAGVACLVVCFGLYWGVQQMHSGYEESVQDSAWADQNMYESAVVNESLAEQVETDMEVTEEMAAAETAGEEKIVYLPKESESEPEVEAASSAEKENFNNIVGDTTTESDAYVIIHGRVKNGQDVWDDFLEKVKVHESTSIDIIQFTIEGDPIITNLQFNGTDFTVVRDNTQDSFAGSRAGVTESSYKYMNLLQESDCVEVILSQETDLTKEQLYSGDFEVYHLIQYEITK